MNAKLETLLPIFSGVMGRDLTAEYNLFIRGKNAIGQSMNQEGQEFFTKNWPAIITFMESPDGQAAIHQFLNAWTDSLKPKVEPPKKPETHKFNHHKHNKNPS